MRCAIVLVGPLSRMTGVRTYVRALLEHIPAVAEGIDLTFVVAGGLSRELVKERSSDVRVVRARGLDLDRRGLPSSAARLLAHMIPRRAGAVLFADADVTYYPLTIGVPSLPGRRIVTLHDLQHRDLPTMFSSSTKLYRRLAYDQTAKRSAAVVTGSEFTKRRICDVLSIPQRKVYVIPWGLDHRRLHPDKAPDEDRSLEVLFPSLPKRYFLYPASFWPHKNHKVLLRAYARAGLERTGLVLTGNTFGRRGVLERWIRDLGLEGRVQHTGFAPDHAVAGLYRRARGMVFPSLYEGFGLPALEAMACGCPVAAARTGALPEVVGQSGMFFDPSDVDDMVTTLRRLDDRDSPIVERMVETGIQRAAQFDWATSARRHVDVLRLVHKRV